MGLLLLVVVECVGDWRLSTLKIEGRSYQESCEDSPKREWKEFFFGVFEHWVPLRWEEWWLHGKPTKSGSKGHQGQLGLEGVELLEETVHI